MKHSNLQTELANAQDEESSSFRAQARANGPSRPSRCFVILLSLVYAFIMFSGWFLN